MRNLMVHFSALISLGAAGRLNSTLGPVVDLGYAAYAGNTTSLAGIADGPVAFYSNIRYAQPPLGDLRFRARREGRGPPCIQRPAVVGVGSEDCLTLNVRKPTNATGGAAPPVVVYIHGGGFFAGHPTGIVAVSIAYRLNLLGFLGGSVLAADGDLNARLLDQRAGLEWIQRHIAEFGGDPANVTIYGESAGAASVVMQAVAYGDERKHLMRRGIGYGPTNTANQSDALFEMVAGFIGCPASGGDAMPCLRHAAVGALMSAINRVPSITPLAIPFGPIIDEPTEFLPDLPSRMPGVSNSTIDQALALYPAPNATGSPFATQWDRASTMAGDVLFSCMFAWFLADQLASNGVENTFLFSWNAPDAVLYTEAPYLGAARTLDLYYLFDEFTQSEAVLSKEAIAPSTDKESTSPTWEPVNSSPHSASAGRRLPLARGGDVVTNSTTESITEAEVQRCQFWMSEAVTAETRV
ncbi:alpha/beta-hydrolase [Mycena maculata]|uniref:Carboxylic ester hydrolase n=1 Tax=Mycena maculata TaxID=230809 RepID=A0AAD7K8U8_9AGAR|nr:alpha/beta-hydrolase [Mycena maculata]